MSVLNGKRWDVVEGDCMEVMKGMPDKSVDVIITDPPYGVDKADWDNRFPSEAIADLLRVGNVVAVMPGIWALGECISAFGDKYKWTIAGYNNNGMTYGRIGYNNWIPVVVGGSVPRRGKDATVFSVKGKKPDHPSPKPLSFMYWLIERLSSPLDIIFDPFCGSGTTGVAALRLGRRFLGIDISAEYCAMARKRIADAMPMFTDDGKRRC